MAGSTRTCGGCTACCKTHQIEELQKPANQWCAHCVVGKGCGVYEERPPSCRDYACVWINFPDALPEDDQRPDRLGVVFSIFNQPEMTGDPKGETLRVFVNEVMEGRLNTKAARRALDRVRKYADERRAGPRSVDRVLNDPAAALLRARSGVAGDDAVVESPSGVEDEHVSD